MTKSQKNHLLRVAETQLNRFNFSGLSTVTCPTVDGIGLGLKKPPKDGLAKQYCKFYNKPYYGFWLDKEHTNEEELNNRRILLILLFREVGLEGLGL